MKNLIPTIFAAFLLIACSSPTTAIKSDVDSTNIVNNAPFDLEQKYIRTTDTLIAQLANLKTIDCSADVYWKLFGREKQLFLHLLKV
jgi:hypothetical protein